MVQLDAPSDWRPRGRGFNPHRGRQHSFVIMKYFLRSFSPLCWFKKGSCQFLAKEFAQYCTVNVWLGKLTTLDMTLLGWLSRKTSTQTNQQSSWRNIETMGLQSIQGFLYLLSTFDELLLLSRWMTKTINRLVCTFRLCIRDFWAFPIACLTLKNCFYKSSG